MTLLLSVPVPFPISFIPVDSSTAIIAAAIGAGIWIWQSIEYSIKKRENKIKT